MAVFAGFGGAVVSVLTSLAYLVYKLLFWRSFEVGVAPILIGFFFLASIHLLFLGMIGEYVGAIHTMVQKRPFAIEQERINFEFGANEPLRTTAANEEKNA